MLTDQALELIRARVAQTAHWDDPVTSVADRARLLAEVDRLGLLVEELDHIADHFDCDPGMVTSHAGLLADAGDKARAVAVLLWEKYVVQDHTKPRPKDVTEDEFDQLHATIDGFRGELRHKNEKETK